MLYWSKERTTDVDLPSDNVATSGYAFFYNAFTYYISDLGVINLELVNEIREVSPEEMVFDLVLDKRKLRLSSTWVLRNNDYPCRFCQR